MTRILVPLDGSRLAEQAICCAMALGTELPAELVLFRAISIPSDLRKALDRAGLESGMLIEKLETEAGEYLQSVARRLLPDAGLGVCHVVQRGPAAAAIVDYARQADIELIVMASHGYSGTQRWIHGCVAERVLHAASVPVLLVRAQETDSDDLQPRCCQRILVPLDGSDVAEQVLTPLAAITQALGCEMILFQVSIAFLFEFSSRAADRMAEAYLKRVAERLEKQGIEASTAVRTGPVVETIVQFAETNQVDLIAMCTHGRTGITRWALGSVADRVLRAGNIPTLLVRARHERNTLA